MSAPEYIAIRIGNMEKEKTLAVVMDIIFRKLYPELPAARASRFNGTTE